MTENMQKELLSFTYVRLICSLAGFAISRPDVDDDSIDLFVHASGKFDARSPSLAVQMKATATQAVLKPDHLAFPLKRKNYDDLRRATIVPRYLLVFFMPFDSADWCAQTEEGLTLHRCVYWVSLRNAPATPQQTITVEVPRANILTPDAIRALMEVA